MSSLFTSSRDSAIMRSVWAKVFTVETVRVRIFFLPRISKWPCFGSYLTLLRLRMGNPMLGLACFRMVFWTSDAVFSIRRTVSALMSCSSRSSLVARLDLARSLQRVGQHLHDLRFLLVREMEDFLQGDADVGDIGTDVGILLLGVLEPAAVAQEGAQPAAALLQTQTQLLENLGIGGDRLLALGGEWNPHAGDVHQQDHRTAGQRSFPLLQRVVLPIRADDRPGDGARRLLVLEGHPVGEAPEVHQLLGRQIASVG